jgi:RNA-binding protein
MQTLTTAERRSLRAKAHHLHPVVTIGAHGLTSSVMHEIDVALKAHELIKIRVLSDVRADRDAFLDQICRELVCAPVQHLGKLLIIWRRNPDLKTNEVEAKAPRRGGPRKALGEATTKGRREESSNRSRIAPPSGAPRAPSRRRRAEGTEAAEPRINDQSRRRRRAR